MDHVIRQVSDTALVRNAPEHPDGATIEQNGFDQAAWLDFPGIIRGAKGPQEADIDLRIGLIDGHRFSQECLTRAFTGLHPQLDIVPFTSVQDFVAAIPHELHIILYCAHVCDGSDVSVAQDLAKVRKALPETPLIVMSDAADAHQPRTIRNTLKGGAHGFIPVRTTGIAMTYATIRFVAAGGSFAPLDTLLTNRADRPQLLPEMSREPGLTARQLAVLSHLQQGKANKIIAHELGMSQSTVKVHVRNIMRKMGATNRTQAAFKAQKLWSGAEFARGGDT